MTAAGAGAGERGTVGTPPYRPLGDRPSRVAACLSPSPDRVHWPSSPASGPPVVTRVRTDVTQCTRVPPLGVAVTVGGQWGGFGRLLRGHAASGGPRRLRGDATINGGRGSVCVSPVTPRPEGRRVSRSAEKLRLCDFPSSCPPEPRAGRGAAVSPGVQAAGVMVTSCPRAGGQQGQRPAQTEAWQALAPRRAFPPRD